MPVQVFDGNQVRCSCVLEIPGWGLLAFDVIRLSKAGGVLKAAPALRLPRGARYRAKLRLQPDDAAVDANTDTNTETTLDLQAIVVSSEKQRVSVRWHHSTADAGRLQAILEGCRNIGATGSAPHQPRVLSEDGRVDVKATLVSRSESIAPKDLLARRRTLRVLQMSAVNSLIEEVVDEAVAGLSRGLRAGERQAVIEEARAGFVERFASLQDEKADLEARAAELERAKAELDAERKAVIEARQFTVSDEGILKLEQRLGRLVDRAVAAGGVSPEAEQQMREVMSRLLDEERERIRASAEAAQSDAILLLERKVERLANSLGNARKERDRARQRAAALEMRPGAGHGNVMKPGLSDDDPRRALKQSLLEELVRDNRWLRQQIRQGDAGTGAVGGP